MADLTSHETVAKRWDIFLRRKAFLMSGTLGFTVDGTTVHAADDVVASLLWLDMVSILDLATATQLTPPSLWRSLRTLDKRLVALDQASKLLDGSTLQYIRQKRNAIAHDIVRIPHQHFDSALATVQLQLESWGLVGPPPRYGFYSEATPEQWQQGGWFEREITVGVAEDRGAGKEPRVIWSRKHRHARKPAPHLDQ